jgi:PiT family inorganic phosphate transporter
VELVIHVGSDADLRWFSRSLFPPLSGMSGTWFFGLPASSSHTLIGSIIGVGVANALVSGSHYWGDGVNWAKAKEVGLALLISPAIGFGMAAILLIVMNILIRNPKLYTHRKAITPPARIRALSGCSPARA